MAFATTKECAYEATFISVQLTEIKYTFSPINYCSCSVLTSTALYLRLQMSPFFLRYDRTTLIFAFVMMFFISWLLDLIWPCLQGTFSFEHTILKTTLSRETIPRQKRWFSPCQMYDRRGSKFVIYVLQWKQFEECATLPQRSWEKTLTKICILSKCAHICQFRASDLSFSSALL